jgi:hypothetical protein
MKMKKLVKPSFPRPFGGYSPTGHVVTAFTTNVEAKKARETLLRNGFSEEEVTHYNKNEVLWEFERGEAQALNSSQIGEEVAKFEEYLELAAQGCGFLVVQTPEDDAAERAVRTVMPFGLKFVEKYKRWTLHERT